MSCMCGDLGCPSCGPAQGADPEHMALCDAIEDILDAHELAPEESPSYKLATFMLKNMDDTRKNVARGFENILTRIVGVKKAKHISNVVSGEDYDEELERWLDEKYPIKS